MDFVPFFLVLLFLFFLGLLERSGSNGLGNYSAKVDSLLLLSLLALVMLAAFRSVGVGSDDEAYVTIFSKIPNVIDCVDLLCGYDYKEINVEVGFFEFLSILHLLGDGHLTLFFFAALIAVFFNLKSIQFFSRTFCGSVLIYFCHFYLAKELNAIRIGLATAIAFFAAKYLYKGRHALFVALVLFATSIHVSAALAFLPAILIWLAPQRRMLIFLSLGVVILSMSIDLSKVVTPLIGVDFLSEKMALYGGAQEYNYELSLFDVVNVRNMILIAFGLVYWENLKRFDSKFQFCFYFFLGAALFRIMFGDFAILAGRGYAAISMFEYIVMPLMFEFFLGRKLGYVLTFILAALTLSLNLYVSTGWSGGVPYFG
ncbi:EpsG family protein [Ralstonia mojiangensis]|uniref:EpsG family protein n=1 Tax=Ralstonia mojiangensis TaxID=2953895 RepID=A0ABT2L4H3_9RALS|nr:EpsG family protein [Ralstonia mojiangensis]MCO5413246.1 EpsG family protein [Ralstonia mojiangensis]MCT7297525.1 EpsG family protein [Ralstonia mojiangensis]MCT7310117.1 EpsG family protein [Ralstonia mojiangensis]